MDLQKSLMSAVSTLACSNAATLQSSLLQYTARLSDFTVINITTLVQIKNIEFYTLLVDYAVKNPGLKMCAFILLCIVWVI